MKDRPWLGRAAGKKLRQPLGGTLLATNLSVKPFCNMEGASDSTAHKTFFF